MGIGFRGVEMGGAMSIIGFVRREKCPHGWKKKLGRMARNEWRFENDGDAGEVAGSKVTSMVGQPSVLGKR